MFVLYVRFSDSIIMIVKRGEIMTDIMTLLESYLGIPSTIEQENMMFFFAFFILVFVISCVFDLLVNITKL